jgi:DNA-binding NtrC family response regulator
MLEPPHLLVVDDEHGIREALRMAFETDYEVSVAEDGEEALQKLSQLRVDAVILDIVMPGRDGLDILQEIKHTNPDIPVVMISALTEASRIVEAMRIGAADYVPKPFDLSNLRHVVARTLSSDSMKRRIDLLETEVSQEYPIDAIVGDAPLFRQALDDAAKAAATDATVLICGESGTGKELIARLLHKSSGRATEPFVGVHCAALSENLMESELFGHEKGAFTHAESRKLGRFDLAGNGTLFFDEVSEMSMATQVKLLRVLQEREFMRVGGTQVIHTSARIVVASALELMNEVNAGNFRSDLYYRLGVVPINLPPLRDRREDIPLLVDHFLGYFRQKMGVRTEAFDDDSIELFTRYRWPGNVRELRNIMERMLVLNGHEKVIEPLFLPDEFHNGTAVVSEVGPGFTLSDAVNAYETQLIRSALSNAAGVQTRAAKLLGTTRRILKYRMDKLNIRWE